MMALQQPPAPKPAARQRLGEWDVDAAGHSLHRGEHQVRLQPRLMQLLLRLMREPGEVVRREQLLDEVWGGRVVNDEVVSRAVAELRQALEDDPRSPRYIETLPKIGYRLVAACIPASVETSPKPSAPSTPPSRAAPALLDDRGLPLADPAAKRRLTFAALVVVAVVVLVAIGLAGWLPPPPGANQTAPDLRARVDRARPFATDPGFDQSARFSRDGRLIAWSASDAERNHATIWVGSRDGQTRRQLSRADAWDLSPVFVEGDTAILFVRYHVDACEIRRQELLGEQSTVIAACAPPPATSRIDVSSDGRRLVFAQRVPGTSRAGLALMDLASKDITPLTDPGEQAQIDLNPRFSSDGAQVAFFRGQHSEQWLWILPTTSPARARTLVGSNGLLYGVAWLPGDNALVLAGDLFGYRALYRVDSGTGALEFLGARGARYPDVAADGALLYEVADYQANLWHADLTASPISPRPITQSQRYNNQPVFSPDGRQLAFASNRDGLESVFVANPDGSGVRRLHLDPRQRWVRPTWRPDGKHLVVTAILNRSDGTECLPYACTSEHSALYDYDLAANRATPLEDTGADARYARYGADGTLYYLRSDDQVHTLWRIDPKGVRRLVLDANVESFDVGERELVVAVQGEAGLRVCELDARNCRTVLDGRVRDAQMLDAGQWTLHQGALYFAARLQDKTRNVQRLDLRTGQMTKVLDDVPSTLPPALAVSPDGKSLVYARNDRIVIDLFVGEPGGTPSSP
ncbi:winged helix-turn-helix domain-containing protein [Tahibacter amnicola]|uniref:Winged helix-turn-helix domain-containing protein n=1 Tax=Tahibacter amnicola TaxID=2976241 RepID=A0ABY6BAT2_9GAMM|nr:winged helix-turn-helix domain-containing protein [Tahibacter amnicola]UXI67173.1 winged helix-turn-helix domain-containing protein [Tahibacter amnicola]